MLSDGSYFSVLLRLLKFGWLFMSLQVHITQGDHVGKSVIISWVTPLELHPNLVKYWEANSLIKHKAQSRLTKYKYYNYTSGYIHHAIIKGLKVS